MEREWEDEPEEHEEDGDDLFDDDEDEALEPDVTIEISGLSLYTHHGVSDAEQEIGQRLVLDLRLEVGACDATLTDRVEDTIDYGEVCQLVALLAQQRSYRTLERLTAAIADRLLFLDDGRILRDLESCTAGEILQTMDELAAP